MNVVERVVASPVLLLAGQFIEVCSTENQMTGIDICKMMKRRLREAGLPTHYSPHSFRVTTVTDLLEQNQALEDMQHLAGHADPRTTRLYDRRRRKVTRNIMERISI